MTRWNASHYLRYGSERTRAASDLVARINLDTPRDIVDIGCGPGNSTSLLRERWPESNVLGIDNSPEMIDAARTAFPNGNWLLCDASDWSPPHPFELVYSNAALQWLPNHGELVSRLFASVATGGVLAFQIPSATYATIRELIFEISRKAQWDARMSEPRSILTMESPEFYYDALVKSAVSLDLWETEYMHVLESKTAIVDWIASTGLRPFLEVLDSESERNEFTIDLQRRVDAEYETRSDGKVIFPFRRTFVIAYR
ncbi:MAG: methyltransferase domain-containing protein [Planctomycetota bacterium]